MCGLVVRSKFLEHRGVVRVFVLRERCVGAGHGPTGHGGTGARGIGPECQHRG
jgi:hypothetical protein